VPASPGTLCALGAVAAAIRRDTMRTVLLPLGGEHWERMQTMQDDLAREAEAAVIGMAGPGDVAVARSADLRYRGQSFELAVPFEAGATADEVTQLFHDAHERSFGHAEPGAPVQVVSLRASASRAAPVIAMPREPETAHPAAAKGAVRLYARGAWCDAALFDREALDAGAEFAGPAIVTQADCTILVPQGWRARVDGLRNVEMELA
jgi:N-methylhydantoinase A